MNLSLVMGITKCFFSIGEYAALRFVPRLYVIRENWKLQNIQIMHIQIARCSISDIAVARITFYTYSEKYMIDSKCTSACAEYIYREDR